MPKAAMHWEQKNYRKEFLNFVLFWSLSQLFHEQEKLNFVLPGSQAARRYVKFKLKKKTNPPQTNKKPNTENFKPNMSEPEQKM